MITVRDGVVRLDDAGVTALLAGDDPAQDMVSGLDRAGMLTALDTARRPVVTLEVLVAGAALQVHRVAADTERAVVLLAVTPGLHQLMVLPPSHVAAALVRMTRTGPRRVIGSDRRSAPEDAAARLLSADADVRRAALHEVGGRLAWRLRVGWDGEHQDLVVVDTDSGFHVVDEDDGALLPVSATTLYRVFSTALPPQASRRHSRADGSAPSSASASAQMVAARPASSRGRTFQ